MSILSYLIFVAAFLVSVLGEQPLDDEKERQAGSMQTDDGSKEDELSMLQANLDIRHQSSEAASSKASSRSKTTLRSSLFTNSHSSPVALQQTQAREGTASAEINLGVYDRHDGVWTLYTNPHNSQDLLVDITDIMNPNGPSKEVMVTSMTAKGTYSDEYGQIMPTHEPLEEFRNYVFAFELSPEGNKVDLLQPNFKRRSTDKAYTRAMEESEGRVWMGSLVRLTCSGDQSRVILDGIQLISMGFFVSPDYAFGTWRIMRAESYESNSDVTVDFMEPSYRLRWTVGWSIVLLPETPMPMRFSDDRLGYFNIGYSDLGVHVSESNATNGQMKGKHDASSVVPAPMRSHRLQLIQSQHSMFTSPVTETEDVKVDTQVRAIWRYDLQRRHQIKIYIDPTVPVRYRQAFKEGIEAWNEGFKLAGYPQGIKAIAPGDEDWPSDYNVADIRFSTISWVINDSIYSMGIAKVDPRSGEIMVSDIVMSDGWVRAWLSELDYFSPQTTTHVANGYRMEERVVDLDVQGAAGKLLGTVEETGRRKLALLQAMHGKELDMTWEEIVDAGLKEVVMHEVGHVLGLRHNFKGNMYLSMECLKDQACTSANGTGSSVMDYNPMNILSGEVQSNPFAPVIGVYDKLAIQYGYTDSTGTEDKVTEVATVLQPLLEQAELIPFCSDGEVYYYQDPQCMPYDLSSTPLYYFRDVIDLVRTRNKNLFNTSVANGAPYTDYGSAAMALSNYLTSIGYTILPWIGGMSTSRRHRGFNGEDRAIDPKRAIAKEDQELALTTIIDLCRPTTSGLLPPAEKWGYLLLEGGDGPISVSLRKEVRARQKVLLESVMSVTYFSRVDEGVENGGPGVSFILGHLYNTFRAALNSSLVEDFDLQAIFADRLAYLLDNAAELTVDVVSRVAVVQARAKDLVDQLVEDQREVVSRLEQVESSEHASVGANKLPVTDVKTDEEVLLANLVYLQKALTPAEGLVLKSYASFLHLTALSRLLVFSLVASFCVGF